MRNAETSSDLLLINLPSSILTHPLYVNEKTIPIFKSVEENYCIPINSENQINYTQ